MSKKSADTQKSSTEAAVVLPTAEALGLVAELAVRYNAMSDEEKAEVAAMASTDPEAAQAFVRDLAAISASGEGIDFDSDDFVDAKPEQEEITILATGGPGLRAGSTIVGELLGTHHIFSKEPKKNWKKWKEGDKTFYYNRYYKLRSLDGKTTFGVWASPTLSILEKIPTNESLTIVPKNPRVQIKYVGLVEGAEKIEKEYGIKITDGDKCHIFQTKVEKGVKYNSFAQGCVNSLNSPFPIVSDDKNKVTREEANRLQYEKLMALQGGTQAQLAQ